MPLSNPEIISYPKVAARKTTNQTLTLNGVTLIVYNSEDKDTHGIHNAANGNIVITSSTEGDYILSASCTGIFSHPSSSGEATLSLVAYKNGGSYSEIGRATETPVSNFPIGASGSILMPNLVAGDIITVRTSTTFISGGSISMPSSSRNHLSFYQSP